MFTPHNSAPISSKSELGSCAWVSYREKGVTGGMDVLRQLDLPRQKVLQKYTGL